MDTARRQNKSCDPCRRSKKRCSFSASEGPAAPRICSNCAHLGYDCTFEYVTSRTAQKRRSRMSCATSVENPIPQTKNCYKIDKTSDVIGGAVDAQELEERINESQKFTMESSTTRCLDPSELSYDFGVEMFDFFANPVFDIGLTADTQLIDTPSSFLTPPRTAEPVSNYSRKSLVGILPTSPIHLLNSSLATNTLNEHLSRIYKTIMDGSASRYLGYGNNLFEVRHPYCFEEDDTCPSTPCQTEIDASGQSATFQPIDLSLSAFQDQRSSEAGSNMVQRKAENPDRKVTTLGVARFLDNFNDLYGNKLDSVARKMSDTVLEIVLQAFSAQWLPSSNSLPQDQSIESPRSSPEASTSRLFLDAWFKARSCLLEAQHIRSFRVIYAIFLFNMTVVPTEASLSLNMSGEDHEFLNCGLSHLCALEKLVKSYCQILGVTSVYATLIESSLNIFRWFGYVRDTVASMTSDRVLFLPDCLIQTKGFVLGNTIPSDSPPLQHPVIDLDARMPRICRKLNGEMLLVWRRIISLRTQHFDFPTHQVSPRAEDITSTMVAVENYEQDFSPVMMEILRNFPQLSMRSRMFSAFVVIFSNLALLSFAECLNQSAYGGGSLHDPTLASKAQSYQWAGASSIAVMVNQILALPPDEASNLKNGMTRNLLITSYHVNLSLIVTALVKAVESLLSLQFNPNSLRKTRLEDGIGQDPYDLWSFHVQSLLKCLVSMDATVSGSHTARKALQNLMRQYGDILSECWSTMDDDKSRGPLNTTSASAMIQQAS